MKKLLVVIALATTLATTFTSCSKDNSEYCKYTCNYVQYTDGKLTYTSTRDDEWSFQDNQCKLSYVKYPTTSYSYYTGETTKTQVECKLK